MADSIVINSVNVNDYVSGLSGLSGGQDKFNDFLKVPIITMKISYSYEDDPSYVALEKDQRVIITIDSISIFEGFIYKVEHSDNFEYRITIYDYLLKLEEYHASKLMDFMRIEYVGGATIDFEYNDDLHRKAYLNEAGASTTLNRYETFRNSIRYILEQCFYDHANNLLGIPFDSSDVDEEHIYYDRDDASITFERLQIVDGTNGSTCPFWGYSNSDDFLAGLRGYTLCSIFDFLSYLCFLTGFHIRYYDGTYYMRKSSHNTVITHWTDDQFYDKPPDPEIEFNKYNHIGILGKWYDHDFYSSSPDWSSATFYENLYSDDNGGNITKSGQIALPVHFYINQYPSTEYHNNWGDMAYFIKTALQRIKNRYIHDYKLYSIKVPTDVDVEGVVDRTILTEEEIFASAMDVQLFDIDFEVPVLQTFSINEGDPTTTSRDVILNNTATNDPSFYMASEDSGFSGAKIKPYSDAPEFELTAGYEVKTVYLKVYNEKGWSNVLSDQIEHTGA